MITYGDVRNNADIRALIEASSEALGAMGITDHGFAHAELSAVNAARLLETLDYEPRTCELAKIAGYMHDIGNAVNRSFHAMTGGLLAFDLLRSMGMETREAISIMTAIGNHDEGTAAPVTPLCAALILADKSDVRRSRVRAKEPYFDIHDRVNYAAVDSSLTVFKEKGLISLQLKIDTSICAVMDYFEIFLTRIT
ncbi:MAG: phosphohydrolase, partial [Oscillospiraceae bacterium]|nr:phosphohydrolase [Oscillospiraceae bacterium]